MVEFHSLWRLPAAQRIARALAEFDTYWHEDPIRMDSPRRCSSSTRRTRRRRSAPPRSSPGAGASRTCLETGVAGIVMFDLALVRRHHRSAPHRRARRCLAAAGRAARLHRPAGLRRLAALLDLGAERAGAGIGARVLHRLVQRAGDPRAAAGAGLLRQTARARASAASCCPRSGSARTRRCASVPGLML